MNQPDTQILFVEQGIEEATDKAHCGSCFIVPDEPDCSETEITDTAHCGGCID